MRVDVFEDSEERGPGTVQLRVVDPLPNVPEWIQYDTNGGDGRPFWTLPAGHYFEPSEGKLGFPGGIADTLDGYAAGRLDKGQAEATIASLLVGWSRATKR